MGIKIVATGLEKTLAGTGIMVVRTCIFFLPSHFVCVCLYRCVCVVVCILLMYTQHINFSTNP